MNILLPWSFTELCDCHTTLYVHSLLSHLVLETGTDKGSVEAVKAAIPAAQKHRVTSRGKS